MERSRRRAITARIINPFIPQSVRDGRPEDLFRARVLVAVLIFNGLVFAVTRPVAAVLGLDWPRVDGALNWLAIMATLAVHGLSLGFFRRTGSVRLAGNVFVGWIFLLLVAVSLAATGPDVDRALYWMLLVPVYGFLTLGLRGGLAWTLLAFAVSGWLHSRELLFLPEENLRAWWDWSMLAVAVVIGLVIYEYVVLRLIGLLDAERRRFADAALHDPLTGLANRAAFDLEIRQRLDRARADGATLALAYLDLDGFKAVNDLHGHHAGDLVLQVVARRLESTFRAGDLVARLGGDEFAVILQPGGPPPPLGARLEQARQLAAQPVDLAGQALRVTASIGVALFPDHAAAAEDLIERADEAMYRAKRSGNQVAFAGPGGGG